MFTPFAFVKQVVSAPAPTYEPLTEAFRVASGITDTTTLDSLNAFELGLAAYSIATSSFQAIYPFVGASSGSMAWNFANTTQYKLTYTGSLTFTSGGIQAAGSPKNGRVGSIPANQLSVGNGHNYFYITDNAGTTGNFQSQVGADGDITDPNLTQYYMTWFGSANLVYPVDSATAGNPPGSISPTPTTIDKGGYTLTRTTSGSMKAFYNGTNSRGTQTGTVSGRSYSTFTSPVHFLSRQNNDATTAQQRLGWGSIGVGLDDTQTANYHTLVANFQTSMSRA